ncbi:MAG: redoxin domain-containing protein [Myxococcales bacterium]|nr:redoxin domain-containing protein [Myxococcales bacterium]
MHRLVALTKSHANDATLVALALLTLAAGRPAVAAPAISLASLALLWRLHGTRRRKAAASPAHALLGDEAGRPVLLHFRRSGWCPVCHVLSATLRSAQAALESANVKLVEVTSTQSNVELRYPVQAVLVDTRCQLAKSLGLFDARADAPIPSAVLIDGDGVVRYAWQPTDAHMPRRDELEAAIASLSTTCRG